MFKNVKHQEAISLIRSNFSVVMLCSDTPLCLVAKKRLVDDSNKILKFINTIWCLKIDGDVVNDQDFSTVRVPEWRLFSNSELLSTYTGIKSIPNMIKGIEILSKNRI